MFDMSSFMPHGHCYLWRPDVLWMHVGSDIVIGLSYFSIPLAMAWFRLRSQHTGRLLTWVIWAFVIFILLCGSTHFIAVWTTWTPAYYFEGVVKVLTAIASVCTAVALWPLIPRVLKIPSPEQLSAANVELESLNRTLEDRVEHATAASRAQAEELRHSNQELRRSNRELDDFAYVASHDLRSPLRGIDNIAQWIEEDCASVLPEESRHDLELLRGRVRRMEDLLEGLLQYSRVGREAQDVEAVNLGQVVGEIAALLDRPAGFTIETAGEMPTFAARKAPLNVVLRNLVNNAIKHRDRDDGRVIVSCRAFSSHYEIRVTDDGPGIPESLHDKVFGLFQTLRPRDEFESSGIGLALVKKTVEREGGAVRLQGNGTDRGVTFVVQWPSTPVVRPAESHAVLSPDRSPVRQAAGS